MLRGNLLDQGVKKSHDNSIFNVKGVTENMISRNYPQGHNEFYNKIISFDNHVCK